jgi:hypothetical protein
MEKATRGTNHRWFYFLFFLFLLLLLVSQIFTYCGDGGNGGNGGNGNGQQDGSNLWDQMIWDQGEWA